MAKQFNCEYLLAYAKKITEDVEMIELEALRKHLGEFSVIIKKIEQTINSFAS